MRKLISSRRQGAVSRRTFLAAIGAASAAAPTLAATDMSPGSSTPGAGR